jgi:hypothetical protein
MSALGSIFRRHIDAWVRDRVAEGDGRDFGEIAREIVASLEIRVPSATLERAHTCDELTDVILAEVTRRRHTPADGDPHVKLRTRISAGDARPGWYLERSLAWTPYAIETITDDAIHAGPGAHLELTVPYDMGRAEVARLQSGLAALRAKGVRLSIRTAQLDEARTN